VAIAPHRAKDSTVRAKLSISVAAIRNEREEPAEGPATTREGVFNMITSNILTAPPAIHAANRRLRACGVAGTLLATGTLWLAGHALGVTFKVAAHSGGAPQTFSPAFLLGFTLQIALAGWATLAILEHYTRRAVRIWTALGVTVLALSFVPIAVAGANAGTKTALCLIHIIVGSILLSTMRRSAARP
jgi:hypothetical protein